MMWCELKSGWDFYVYLHGTSEALNIDDCTCCGLFLENRPVPA